MFRITLWDSPGRSSAAAGPACRRALTLIECNRRSHDAATCVMLRAMHPDEDNPPEPVPPHPPGPQPAAPQPPPTEDDRPPPPPLKLPGMPHAPERVG